MIVIRMADGIIFNAYDDSLEEFTERFHKALKKKKVIVIENALGIKRILNPLQVLYFEENM